MAGNKEAQNVLQWVQLGMMLLPQLMSLIAHYKHLSDSEQLSETDKERMKANLRALNLPNWDDII